MSVAGLERMTTGLAVSALSYRATQVDSIICHKLLHVGLLSNITRIDTLTHTLTHTLTNSITHIRCIPLNSTKITHFVAACSIMESTRVSRL